MRHGSIGTVRYSPAQVPAQYDARFLREELDKIAAAINALALGHLDKVNVMPSKPRDGDIRYLDSTIAPGSVAGIYYYNLASTSWKILG